MTKKPTKKKNPVFFQFIYFLLLLIVIIFSIGIYNLDILPLQYFLMLITGVVILISFFGLILLNRRAKKGIKVFFSFISVTLIIGMAVVSNFSFNTKEVLNKITKKVDYKTENYSLVVLSGAYGDIADLDNQDIGFLDNGSQGINKALAKLEQKIAYQDDDYDDVKKLSDDLLDEKVKAILVEESFKDILDEESRDFKDNTEILYTLNVQVPEQKTSKKVDVTTEPFNIYLTGIDTYGKITSVARSDVNIIATVNPQTGKVLLTSIPRDYYVELAGKNAKDKLTHAGIYGVETSVKTIEDLLDININYYVKVNFSSVEKIVDELGGITVHSDYNFISQAGYKYVKGDNILNGQEALSFARERHSFAQGDIQRGKDQMYVIEGMMDKLMTFSSITKFNNLLDTVEGTFETNVSTEEISKLIKMQLDKKIAWTIEANYLDGQGASMQTYSTKTRSYVMVPDIASVASAQTKINKVINENI